jgi:hypothetical protein
MTEDDLHGLFREMRDEPVPPDSLARVRMAVAERTASPTAARRWPWLGLAAAVCLALAVVTIWFPSEEAKVPAPVIESAVAPPKVPAVQASAPVKARLVQRKPVLARKPKSNNSNITIRIETPDPDVVIFLVGDGE